MSGVRVRRLPMIQFTFLQGPDADWLCINFA
jgi:hypothetical protein